MVYVPQTGLLQRMEVIMSWISFFDRQPENGQGIWYYGEHDYAKMMDDNVVGTECVIIGRGK
jgi:hypothetical protein